MALSPKRNWDLPPFHEQVPGTFANRQGDIWTVNNGQEAFRLTYGRVYVSPAVAIMSIWYGWSIVGVRDPEARIFEIERRQGDARHG